MKNKFTKIFFQIAAFLTLSFAANAQQDLTLYNMNTIGQSIRVNPSLMPVNKYYVGIPLISSTYFLFSHNAFVYHDFYKVRSDDSVQIDVNNALNQLKKTNFLKTDLQVDYLSLGISLNKFYITGNITEHVAFRFAYAKELLELIHKGNGPFVGQTIDFSKTGFDSAFWGDSVPFKNSLAYACTPSDLILVIAAKRLSLASFESAALCVSMRMMDLKMVGAFSMARNATYPPMESPAIWA